ncbi:MAG: dihydrofolate reductase family protein [Terracidiphilus sp.]|jgi:dihydrofolate reductase
MSKLIQWNLITLDGYFEGVKSWDIGWFQSSFNEELESFSIEQLRSTDMLIFGRVTYEGMAAYWQSAKGTVAEFMNGLPKTVFSRTMEHADWANTRLVKDNPVAEVRELKRHYARNIFVFGSGKLCATLLEAGLFDEVRLALAPLVLGSGSTLFGRQLKRVNMKLLEARSLTNSYVILRYEPLANQ